MAEAAKVATSTSSSPKTSTPEWSRVHRYMIGDRVAMLHEYHDNEDLTTNDEGTVTAFANDEKTYLEVTFDNGTIEVLTEDELRHLPSV